MKAKSRLIGLIQAEKAESSSLRHIFVSPMFRTRTRTSTSAQASRILVAARPSSS